MKQERFFEKFEQFADAPNAVAKMRELVLQLACSGRIANQGISDQTATELLSEIFEARNQFIKEGKGKSRVEGSMITAGDTMDIPATWTRCMISEVCDLQTGATPSRQVSAYFGGDIPWLVSGDINRGEILECDGRITEAGLRNSNCKVIPSNSVLIALNGQGKTRATVALLRIEATLNQSLVAMIPYAPERLLPEYLFWNLRGRYYAIRDITGQDQRRGLNMKLVGQLSLPLPPLAEQKRIVAKVDELMALCDRLEAQQQERDTRHAELARASLARFAEALTPANLDFLFHPSYAIAPADLRKSILTLAVQGKLVHRIESEGIGSDILEKSGVLEDRPDDVPELPAHWVWARLGSIATRMDSGWSPACIPEPSKKGEWGVLKTTAVQTLQYQEEQNKTLPPNLEPRPEHEVMDGDILFTRAGPMNRVGILCVARPTRKKLMISDKIIRFHLIAGIDPDFAALSMNAGHSSKVVEGLKSGMAASQVNISQPKLRSVPIPIPPLAEQRRIVAKVDQLMALVDRLETQLAASRASAEKLMAAVVAELTA